MRQLDLLITSGLLLLLTALAITTAGHKLSGAPPLFSNYREREPNNSANRAVVMTTIALSSTILLFTVVSPLLQLATWGTSPLERIAQPLLTASPLAPWQSASPSSPACHHLQGRKIDPQINRISGSTRLNTSTVTGGYSTVRVRPDHPTLFHQHTAAERHRSTYTALQPHPFCCLPTHLQTAPQAQPQNRVLLTELQRTTTEVSAATGLSHAGVIYRYLPYLHRRALLTLLLTFSFVMRELPATYLLHPIEGESIAVVCYDGVLRHSNSDVSAPALTLILLGLLTIPTVVAHYRTLFSQTLNRR